MELHSLGVIGVKGEVKRVGRATGTLICEGTQTIRGAHERELNVELFVVTSVEVDGLTAILVLTKFREANGLGREIGGSLDSERHCVVGIIHLLDGLTLSKFYGIVYFILFGVGVPPEPPFVVSLRTSLSFSLIIHPGTYFGL